MTGLKWHLEIIDHKAIREGKFNGDRYLNTYIENFFTLDQAWEFIGGKLKKQRFGYSGLKGDIEYILTRKA